MLHHQLHDVSAAFVLAVLPLHAQGAAVAPTRPGLDAAFAAALPPPAESRWTLVPWRHSLTDALVEAKQTQRPIYLYVNDGDVVSARC